MSTLSVTYAPQQTQALLMRGGQNKRGNLALASFLLSLFPSFPFLKGFPVPGTGDIEMKRSLGGQGQVGERML